MSRLYDALKQAENPLIRGIEQECLAQTDPAAAALPPPPPPDSPLVPESGLLAPLERPDSPQADFRILALRPRRTAPLLPFDGTDRHTAESYRILRTNLLQHAARPRMFAVASAGQGDGKTVSAINIAGVLALKQDIRVLLVDADLRKRSLAPQLGIPDSPGLADVLSGQCPIEDAVIRAHHCPNLHVLPAGATPANPAELLDSQRWRDLCLTLRQRFDFLVIDTTPIGAVADYDLIQDACDGVLLVVRPEHTSRQDYIRAVRRIPKAKLLGAVINCVQDWWMWRVRQVYGYPIEDPPVDQQPLSQ